MFGAHLRKTIFNPLGQRLAALFYPASPKKKGFCPAIVVCHGFTGSKEGGGRALQMAEQLQLRGFCVLLFDFSGCGESEGAFAKITLSAQINDLGAVVAWCRREGLNPLYLTGRSFGGTTALLYSGEDPDIAATCTWAAVARPYELFRGLLEVNNSSPDDPLLMIQGQEGTVSVERAFFADLHKHNPLRSAAALAPRPFLVIHGLADNLVLPQEGKLLYEAAGEPKELCLIDGADHRFSGHDGRVWEVMFRWLEKIVPEGDTKH